jgi:hypothetical protein
VLGEDGIPEWVPESERRVLKGGGFKGEIKPTVVVAKDGSGKFKTINEALTAMPKTYDGRYIYIVGEPFVLAVPLLEMSMWCVMTYDYLFCAS